MSTSRSLLFATLLSVLPGAVAVAAPGTGAHAPDNVNPFAGARLYVDPAFSDRINDVAGRVPAEAERLRKLSKLPTALWLDSIAQTKSIPGWLDDARKQQQANGQPVIPVIVVYDLPGRDCAAASSAGELAPDAAGEARYRREFIDVIAKRLQAQPSLRIAVVLEPDSLANVVTNMEIPRCTVAEPVYRRSIAYAISKLSLPNVYVYLDAGHSQWLGWPRNLKKSVGIFKQVLASAGGAERVRGFAVNVSNYNPVHDPTTKRTSPDEPSPDESAYVRELGAALTKAGVSGKAFLIDTSRNGRPNIRTDPGSWCNVKGAGLGERPRIAPELSVDAYVWIKPPGDSDGTSNRKAARFDQNCVGDDAAPNAPEAGALFESYLLDLVKNANPPL
jgi:cellulose 1,4-beta-cellobiosidase